MLQDERVHGRLSGLAPSTRRVQSRLGGQTPRHGKASESSRVRFAFYGCYNL